MKIYLVLIRVVLFCVTISLLAIGGLFLLQNWDGGKLMLAIGAAFTAIILIDVQRTKRLFN